MPTASEIEKNTSVQHFYDTAPRIIPRSDHPISRKNIDREALKVLYRLRDAGHVAFLVGGGVRDLYLGKTPKDFDISTDARPGQLRKLFKNSRLIGRRFRLVQVFFRGGKIIEVSTFRKRSEFDEGNGDGTDKVLAANNTFGSPVEDAFRRDLTINSLFYEIQNFTIIDYTGGVEDLDKGIIRIIGNPERRITRDPVRMMRVIRHAARNNFAIEDNTWRAIREHREKLRLCPVSRIRDEFTKDLRGGASKSWAKLAIDSGLLVVVFPFYENHLTEDVSSSTTRKLLLDLLAVADRIHKHGIKIPEDILLALFLLPWIEAEMHLIDADLKSSEAYRYSREIREKMNRNLEHLSIKRGLKESISTLTANLSLFRQFSKSKKWPKWLRRKSYYNSCMLFFRMYRESQGGHRVDLSTIASIAADTAAKHVKPGRKRKNRRGYGGGGPAFTSKNRNGIFGLKKRPGKRK